MSRRRILMGTTFYFSAWTDSGCLLGCPHEHQTVTSAAACISCAGGYVVAVERGTTRALNDAEQAEFHKVMYGSEDSSVKCVASDGALGILPIT